MGERFHHRAQLVISWSLVASNYSAALEKPTNWMIWIQLEVRTKYYFTTVVQVQLNSWYKWINLFAGSMQLLKMPAPSW
jgi:hypothetical protein